MSAAPVTIRVSIGPDTSAMGVEPNSSPQLAVTGPPRALTTSRWYSTPGSCRVAQENTSSGPVTSRI